MSNVSPIFKASRLSEAGHVVAVTASNSESAVLLDFGCGLSTFLITDYDVEDTGGWPLPKRGDFDQAFLRRLVAVTKTVNPCRTFQPSYVFRWGSTGGYHGQGLMRGPSDVEWYERVIGVGPVIVMDAIEPERDVETVRAGKMMIVSSPRWAQTRGAFCMDSSGT